MKNSSQSPSENSEKIDRDWIKMIEGPRAQVRGEELYPQLRQWIDRFQPKSTLEIGCGQGICSDEIEFAF